MKCRKESAMTIELITVVRKSPKNRSSSIIRPNNNITKSLKDMRDLSIIGSLDKAQNPVPRPQTTIQTRNPSKTATVARTETEILAAQSLIILNHGTLSRRQASIESATRRFNVFRQTLTSYLRDSRRNIY